VGLNPGTVYWIDVSYASYYVKIKMEIKVAKWGTPKNIFKKTKKNTIPDIMNMLNFFNAKPALFRAINLTFCQT
jgi:hypothetical protein